MIADNLVAILEVESRKIVGVISKCLENGNGSIWGYKHGSKRKLGIKGDEGKPTGTQCDFWGQNQKDGGLLRGKDLQLICDSPGIKVKMPSKIRSEGG